MKVSSTRLRAAALAAFVSLFVFVVAVPAAPTASAASPAEIVIAKAKSKLGAPWVWGAVGPNSFDCSGLVYWAFRETGYLSKIGGSRMSGYGYYKYFRDRGRTSTTSASPGDLVVWGGGSHIGIYLGGGQAISTLTNGVRIHGVHAVTAPFTAYLRTGMSSGAVAAATSSAGYTIRHTTATVAYRTGWSTANRLIQYLPYGQRLYVYGYKRDTLGRIWYQVKLGFNTLTVGYVAGWYTRAG